MEMRKKEGRKLGVFNDALSTFYFRLYDVLQMIKDHSARDGTCCYHYIGHYFELD